mgnify:CR=1 FL=1
MALNGNTIKMKNEVVKKADNQLSSSFKNNKLLGDWIQNETEHAIALTYSEKKIGDYNREDMTKLVELMAQWRLLLGVTSESTEAELIVICQFVYDNFKKFTLSDIRLAMNWAISGKTDIGFVSQKSISSFYVSKAINAYEDYKRQIFNDLMERRERYLQRNNVNQPVEPTPEEKANTFKDLIVGMYKSHKNGQAFYDFGDFVYNWMKSTNQLKASPEEVNAAVFYGQEKYRAERRGEVAANIMKNLINNDVPDNKEQRQKKYAREYMIMKYFEKHTIGEIISKIHPNQF